MDSRAVGNRAASRGQRLGMQRWAEVGRGQVQSRKCGVGTDYDAESLFD